MASIRPYHPLLPAKPGEKRERSTKQDGWQLSWKDHRGKWKTRVFRSDQKNAEKLLRRIVAEVDEITAGLKAPPEKAITLSKAIQLYLKHLDSTKRSPATIARYTKSYKVFERFMPRDIRVGQIKRRDIERFRAIRLETCTEAAAT